MTEKKYTIFLNGEYLQEADSFYRMLIASSDCSIAVDGGRSLFERLKLYPDIILADFDSSSPPNSDFTGEVMTFDSVKDKTDGELALQLAIDRGATEIALCGYRGGPATDQILGNLLLLQRAADIDSTVNAFCLSGNERVYFVRNGKIDIRSVDMQSIDIQSEAGATISVIALDEQITLSATGLQYPANELNINRGESTGLSNILLGKNCKLELKGAALVFIRRDS